MIGATSQCNDPLGIKLSRLELASYASGSAASNLTWNFAAGFLIVYYSDVALIPVATIGTVVLAARIFDAIFDPLAGMVIDRTNTRWGKCRPYFLWMTVPFAVCSVMVFSVPIGWSLNARIIYASATFGILGILYSFLYVPYGALQPLMTNDRNQLLTLSGLRAMGTSIASIFVYALAVPLIMYFGGGAGGYRAVSAIFATVTVGLYLITFFNCRERIAGEASTDSSALHQAIPRMLKNPVWLIGMSYELLIFVRLGIFASIMAFYAKLVIGSMSAISILLPVMSAAILTGSIIAPAYLRRFGKRKGIIYVQAFTILAFSLVPAFGTRLETFIPILFLGAVGGGIQSAMAFALIAESVDLQQKMFGFRDAGLLTSIAAFNQKVGFAIGSATIAWSLAWMGYRPGTASVQAASALKWLMCLAPIFLALVQAALISFYRHDTTLTVRTPNRQDQERLSA